MTYNATTEVAAADTTIANIEVATHETEENRRIPVEGDIEGLEARTKIVREEFDASLVEEGLAADRAEERNARLMHFGYNNALDWLANKEHLYRCLTNAGIMPRATDTASLLGAIAKYQLGQKVVLKDGTQVWRVQSRRDERLGRFYRIFNNRPSEFPRETLEKVILAFPKRSGGILASATPKKVSVGKTEKAENRKLAKLAAPLAKVELSSPDLAKQDEYQLVLARVRHYGVDICEVVTGQDALVQTLTDKWAAKAALTVASSAK